MKILIASYVFYPSMGGIEAVSAMLAEEFVRRGLECRVATCTADPTYTAFPYEVIRQPKAAQLFQLIRWSDVVLHSNLSMRLGWPMLLARKPWVVSHHTWIPKTLLGFLKRRCLMDARNISVSRAVAAHVGVPSTVIPSPYDNELFYECSHPLRNRDLVFVGRLVSDKGVDCILRALYLLKRRHIQPTFTIVGTGPEEPRLREMVADLELGDRVSFAGAKRGTELADELRRYRVLVVPSLYEEPFGIVALEGIASGCAVVGSDGGGLKDAIGPCGITFPNGDVSLLADCLAFLLSSDAALEDCRREARSHLARFTKSRIASGYLSVLQAAMCPSRQRIAAELVGGNEF